MKKPKIVYLVTSGDYSDYSINGAFSSRVKAQAFIDYERKRRESSRYRRNDYDIEEYELDSYLNELERGLTCYYVLFRDITRGEAGVSATAPTEDTGAGES